MVIIMEHDVTFPVSLVIICMARQKSRVLPLATNILEYGTTLYLHVKVDTNLNGKLKSLKFSLLFYPCNSLYVFCF